VFFLNCYAVPDFSRSHADLNSKMRNENPTQELEDHNILNIHL